MINSKQVFNVLQLERKGRGNEEGFSDVSASEIASIIGCPVQAVNACLGNLAGYGLAYTVEDFVDLSVPNGERLILVDTVHDCALYNADGDLIDDAIEYGQPCTFPLFGVTSHPMLEVAQDEPKRFTIIEDGTEEVTDEDAMDGRMSIAAAKACINRAEVCYVGTCLWDGDVTYFEISKASLKRRLAEMVADGLSLLTTINASFTGDHEFYIW